MQEGSGERQGQSGLTRWLLIGAVALIGYQLMFGGGLFGGNKGAVQPISFRDGINFDLNAVKEQTCTINGPRFIAELGTNGASIRHFTLTEDKYKIQGSPIEIVSATWENASATITPGRAPLRTEIVAPGSDAQQVEKTDLPWKLAASDGESCTFTYEDEGTSLTKVVTATGKPYELQVTLDVKNTGKAAKMHRATVEQTANRVASKLESSLGRQSEWMTEAVISGTKVERLGVGEFEPGDFKDDGYFTGEKWRRVPGDGQFAAVASAYLSQIVIPLEGGAAFAEARVEEKWDTEKFKDDERQKDPKFSHNFRTRIAWDPKKLEPGQSVTYKALAYMGPKERELLAAVGHGVDQTINLGWFAPIAKVLIGYLHVLHSFLTKFAASNVAWGLAIIFLTLTVKTLLLPLSLAPMKSAAQMRKLKPEMDAIAVKYKDDLTQRTLAIQELYKKHGMSQFDALKGCIPALLQMPVFFALYTALQTAIELYHVSFGPFIPDLSEKGDYYIIPLVLGASSFLQQKLMPMQGDPVQAKMMLYTMPLVFTVMMLFLPAGLGVYMLTNTWFTIGQTVLVERWMKAKTAGTTIEVREKAEPEDPGPKGKARPVKKIAT